MQYSVMYICMDRFHDIYRNWLHFCFQVVQLIRDDILSHAGSMPPEFVKKIMQILNKGSIHATPSDQFIGKISSMLQQPVGQFMFWVNLKQLFSCFCMARVHHENFK